MSKTTDVLPFTELVERVRQIARVESPNDLPRARGAVNLAYTRDLPREEDWSFLVATSAVATSAAYDTGTATINTQNTSVTFSSDATIPASTTGWRIRFSANPNVYDFTRANNTGGTISPPLSGDQNITNGSYSLFNPYYALAENFGRFLKDKGLERWSGGKPEDLVCVPDHDFKEEYSSSPGVPTICRLVTRGTDGLQYLELSPPPKKSEVYPYEYIRKLLPLVENTAGTVAVTNTVTAVTGSAGNAQFTRAGTGTYFRVENDGTGEDSEWYRVLGITHNSSLTLQVAYSGVTNTTASYTLSAAPLFPPQLHDAVLYQAVKLVTADQNDPLYQYYDLQYRRVITDAKRLYKSRAYSQEVETVLEDYNFRR